MFAIPIDETLLPMRNKVLLSILAAALLADIAGIVFLVLFVGQQNTIHKLKKERNILSSNLAAMKNSAASFQEKPAELPEKHNFIAIADGTPDVYALSPPLIFDGSKDLTLIVYLHGMGSNYLEPFMVPKGATIAQAAQGVNPAFVFASLSYRTTTSWLNDKALADINQNIRELCQRYPIKRIVIMGTSMGGCSSLAYSVMAPADIKEKMVGVVASEAAGDLGELYKKTPSNMVRSGILVGLGGTPQNLPQVYGARSFINNLGLLQPGLRVALISAQQDTVIPPQFQKEIKNKLEERAIPCLVIETPDKHGIPEAKNYTEGLNFVMRSQ